jgi:CheY-like chemotaxis protein
LGRHSQSETCFLLFLFVIECMLMPQFRVLIVDDQHEVRRMLAASLRTLGKHFDVLEVPSGEEALLISSQLPLDLVVADVRLPGMSGLELVTRLQKRTPQTRIILVTGVDEPRLRRQVADAGADAFFYKPVEMADFLDAVERCLGLAGEAFPLPPVAEEPVAVKGHKTTPLSSRSAAVQAAPQPVSLPDRLVMLRRQLNAVSVTLLDDSGRVVAEAGNLPEISASTSLIPALMGVLSASLKVAHGLGREKTPDNLMCFSGGRFHLCLAPVGRVYALLIVSLDNFTPGRLSEIGQAVSPAAGDLLQILENMGVELEPRQQVPPQPVELPQDVTVDAATQASVDALFKQAVKKKINTSDADAFWDPSGEKSESDGSSDADALSYEQARKLGLTPENGEQSQR